VWWLHIYHSICWWIFFLNWWTFGEVTGKIVDCSCAPFALHFCPQRCWSRQISWIACVLRTETVTNRCYINKQINVSVLSTNIKLLGYRPVYWPTYRRHQWLTDCWSWHFAATAFLRCGSCVEWVMGFFYMADVNNILLVNERMLISLDI